MPSSFICFQSEGKELQLQINLMNCIPKAKHGLCGNPGWLAILKEKRKTFEKSFNWQQQLEPTLKESGGRWVRRACTKTLLTFQNFFLG
jgi:hypothetical protein